MYISIALLNHVIEYRRSNLFSGQALKLQFGKRVDIGTN